jgi:hypothetical protein
MTKAKKAWPAHYSETDIARIQAVLAWLKSTKRGRQWFVSRVTYGKSSVLNALNGYYASNPKPVLDALEEAIAGTSGAHAFVAPKRAPAIVEPAPMPDISIPVREAEQQAPQAPARAGEWEPGAYHWPTPSERIQSRINKLIGRSSAANPMPAGDLIAQLGGDEASAWRALESLIAARQVMTAVVWKAGLSSQVVYPMGRIPTTRPGPKERVRGPAIVITPRSVYGGNRA